MTLIHVRTSGNDAASGSASEPVRTINRAAALAFPGDTVVVHAGTYREWVRPPHGGLSDVRRITFTAAPGERAVITGAERVTGWRDLGGGVWTASVPNAVFGDFNPFAVPLEGDWMERPNPQESLRRHLGDVYLEGRSLREAASVEEVRCGGDVDVVMDDWTGREMPVADPEWEGRRWFAEVGPEVTIITARFGLVDPNAHLTEINVRPAVFRPERLHVDWITVRGFELAQAATQWAPPTAEQEGLVGPNWAKGWVIEDNLIHDSKCVGVSLGKEGSTGQNYSLARGDKSGYQYQLESVFAARRIGWDREHIGSHVVRRNEIRDCGQAGVAGHLGCVFSVIEDNHIHRIAVRREFWGHEIAGIKLHAAIDTVIRGNHIHDCSLGTWLDWQTQGTRVTRNVYHHNCRDLFVEVSHGPYVVDCNVLASPAAVEDFSEGGAYLHNLVAGTIRLETVMDRATPYHVPHSTQLAGFALIAGGDDRWVGNLFIGGERVAYTARALSAQFERTALHGTVGYADYPADFAEYLAAADPALGDHLRFYGHKLPAYVRDNVYLAGAQPRPGEPGAVQVEGDARVEVNVSAGGRAAIELTLPAAAAAARVPAVGGRDLPAAHYPGAGFEEPDGAPLLLAVDVASEPFAAGDAAGGQRPAGPFARLAAGTVRREV